MARKSTKQSAVATPAEPVAEAKPAKVTARDQGVPEVYLSESGAFRPGYDAKMKSDLINAVLGSPVLHVFTEDEALSILESRGWLPMLEKSREARARRNGESA
jgi:hypothetical protein